MVETRFTRLVGCSVPVQQAPMGPVSPPGLALAVAAAGGLGTLHAMHSAAEVEAACGLLPEQTPGALALNVLVPFVDRPTLELAARRCRVIDFFWGPPDPQLVELAHRSGALAGWQVGSIESARAAADAGCDLVTAQGVEAGGHHDGRSALMPLLEACRRELDVPVLAAGGIGGAEDVERVMAAGADGVRVGTRFIATDESGAHPRYQQALITAQAEDAVETDRFSIDCPLCPSHHGVLRRSLEAAEVRRGQVVARLGENGIPAFAGMPPLAQMEGELEAMCMYAGRGVAAVRAVQPAAAVVAELAEGAARASSRGAARR
ncbi:nitronate monooxygenase [Pseudonocardia hispaniensis]|uniref:Nitronate monooxygenase n=1 Tax=Pseudonocardia hispaniensis TaxID=904933 RepID=A0ABW1IVW9_9PSEU